MDTHSVPDWLSTEAIESPLRRTAGANVRLSGDWTCEQFKGGVGETLGVWRVSGLMSTPDDERPWSLVLKGWACGESSGSPSSSFWPWREADLYRSGMLDDLAGVSAPACHGAVERGDTIWVWLDDLTVFPQPAWTVHHFAIAARLLGQFNGAYLERRPNPAHPGLSRNWLEGWVASGAAGMDVLDRQLDHPRVREILPPDVAAAFRRSWECRDATFEAIRSMPQVFTHQDAFSQNAFFRPRNGDEELVLIDWSFAGVAALGEELAALVVASAVFDPALLAIIDDVERVAFAAYIDGLRDAGWRGDQSELWRVYRSTAILRYGPAGVARWLPIVTDDATLKAFTDSYEVPAEFYIDHLATLSRWMGDRVDEA